MQACPVPVSAPSAPDVSDRKVVAQLQESPIFRDYQEAFETTTDLPLVLREAGSFQAPMAASKKINSFCALMAARNKSCAACLQLQLKVEESSTQEPTTMECFAGLCESAVPIRAGDKLLGYLQTGQVLLRPPTKSRFQQTVRQLDEWGIDADRAALDQAYFGTRVVT